MIKPPIWKIFCFPTVLCLYTTSWKMNWLKLQLFSYNENLNKFAVYTLSDITSEIGLNKVNFFERKNKTKQCYNHQENDRRSFVFFILELIRFLRLPAIIPGIPAFAFSIKHAIKSALPYCKSQCDNVSVVSPSHNFESVAMK